jgi:hypothetical protein
MWEINKYYLRVKEQRNIRHEISKRKADWIAHILRRNCLLRQVIEEKIKGGIEVTGRRGRRHRKLLDDLKESRGYSYLKEEALDTRSTMWRARFGRGFGPVVRQTAKWINEWLQASAANTMRSSLFLDVTLRWLVVSDVSGQPIDPNLLPIYAA